MTSNENSQAIVILLKSLSGRDQLQLEGEMIIGRGADCDLVVADERLSRKHAKLVVADNTITVEDLGSTNGTFVNDTKTDGLVSVKHNDIIKFDTFAYQMCISGGAEDEATKAGPAVVEDETIEAKTRMFAPPKSWALDDNPSADGTLVMTPDMLTKPPVGGADSDTADIEVDAPVLVCMNGAMKGKQFKFTTRDKLTKWEIGRDDSCDVMIDDGSVSANHAQLIHDGKRWKLIDLMSANGTYINGNKGLSSYLSSGDVVRFGQVGFQFKLSEKNIQSAVVVESVAPVKLISAWAVGLAAFIVTAGLLLLLLW